MPTDLARRCFQTNVTDTLVIDGFRPVLFFTCLLNGCDVEVRGVSGVKDVREVVHVAITSGVPKVPLSVFAEVLRLAKMLRAPSDLEFMGSMSFPKKTP